MDLRLCEGVIKAIESGVCGFQGPTEIFNSLCKVKTAAKGVSVGVGNNSNKPRHYLLD